jgi:pyridoxal phosphate enzyme (YggS family)
LSDTIRSLEESLAAVRGRIAAACERAGRQPADVRLIGVTKRVPSEAVAAAARAGLTEFGENYVQELTAKRYAAPEAVWHFVGRLQRNKVRRVLQAADVIQTLEPGSATERLAALAEDRDGPADCLVEVDFTGGRVGVRPEEAGDFLQRLDRSPGIVVRGLMTVPPLGPEPRPWFRRLRELRDRLSQSFEGVSELSMGMSADLEAAVEEGATMVRVGTAIFGPRTPEPEGRRR